MKKILKVLGIVIISLSFILFNGLISNLYIFNKMYTSFEWRHNYLWKVPIPDAKKTTVLMYIDYNNSYHEKYIVKFKYELEDFKIVSSMVDDDYTKEGVNLIITSKNADLDILTYINNSYIGKAGDNIESKEFLEKVLSLIGDNKKYIVSCDAFEHSFGMWYDPLSILIIDEEEQSVYEVYST